MSLRIVLAGPSGIGKTTVCRALLDSDDRLRAAVSHTTRAPRVGEEDGVHYHFVSDSEFLGMVDRGEFLEWSRVHDHFYGTRGVVDGDGLYVLDLNGAAALRKLGGITIFLVPPGLNDLRTRMARRGTDSLEVIERRLGAAREEIARGVAESEYVVINSRLDVAIGDAAAIIRSERIRRGDRARILENLVG